MLASTEPPRSPSPRRSGLPPVERRAPVLPARLPLPEATPAPRDRGQRRRRSPPGAPRSEGDDEGAAVSSAVTFTLTFADVHSAGHDRPVGTPDVHSAGHAAPENDTREIRRRGATGDRNPARKPEPCSVSGLVRLARPSHYAFSTRTELAPEQSMGRGVEGRRPVTHEARLFMSSIGARSPTIEMESYESLIPRAA